MDDSVREQWETTGAVIGAMIEVHQALGPGLLESAYEAFLCHELTIRRLPFERQRPISCHYKGAEVDCGFRLDIVVAGTVLVELKSVAELLPIHVAQVVTYLRFSGLPVALLVNFNARTLRSGLRRIWLSDHRVLVRSGESDA